MTSLTGPFDGLPREEKSRVQCLVASEVYDDLFNRRFTMRGAQDRITATLLDWFNKELTLNNVPLSYDFDNEHKAQELFNQLSTFHVKL